MDWLERWVLRLQLSRPLARMGTPAIIGSAYGEAINVITGILQQRRRAVALSGLAQNRLAGPGGLARHAVVALRDDPRALPLRVAFVVAVAMTVARLHAAVDPGVLCPLRRLTGVPCPLCGSTTAVVELGWGHLRAALAAQPFTMALTAGLVAAPAALLGACRRLASRPRLALGCVLVVAMGSWVYQLFRFGIL